MSKTLDEIRKKLEALNQRKGGATGGYSNDKLTYAHWNIAEGTQATLRLLPDGDEDNTFFWAERQLIKLPFPGIKGHDENKPVIVQVPCVEMWDGKMTCPILNEVRPMWKDKSLEDLARKYWVKKTYYAHGFVKQDGLNEQDPPENPIRKFIIGPQIFKIFQAALMDTDMENSPVDYINGTDFIVAKTSKGGFADYGTSKWARKESSLTEAQLAAIEQYGLPKLSDYLPKRPTEEQKAAMFEMFQASLDGELYDPARWSQYYKPFGFDSAPGTDDGDAGEGARVQRPAYSAPKPAPVAAPKPAPVVTEAETKPWEDDVNTAEESFKEPVKDLVGVSTAPAGKSPQEILAMLRNRNKQ
jgi:hypothetical protein